MHVFCNIDISHIPLFLTDSDIKKVQNMQIECLRKNLNWDQCVNPFNVLTKTEDTKKTHILKKNRREYAVNYFP